MLNHRPSTLELGGNRQHLDVATRRLPESFKHFQCWRKKIGWGMHARADVADERTFQMDAGRFRTPITRRSVSLLNRIRQFLERRQGLIHGRSHCRWKIRGHPVLEEQFLDRRQRVGGSLHDVMSRAAMNVHINETRHQRGITQIDNASTARNLALGGRRNPGDRAVFDE
jgi:hypothetical protein